MLIMLDLDGTLVDSMDAHVKAFKDAFKEFGLDVPEELIWKNVRKKSIEIVKNCAPSLLEKAEEVIKRKKEIFFSSLSRLKLFPGVIDFLKWAREEGHHIVIVTTSSVDQAKRVLEHFRLSKYVDFLVGEDMVRKVKPDPEPLLLALARFGEKGVMIGDAEVDEEAAKRANVPFLMFGRDFKDFKELKKKLEGIF